MGSSDRKQKAETRTKLCSSCKGVLDWEATFCEHCGAGRRERPDDGLDIKESWYYRKIDPHLPRLEYMVIGGAVLVLLIGGFFILRNMGQKSDKVEGLQAERAKLVQRVEELSTKKAAIMEDALALKRRARKEEAAVKYTAAEKTAAEAEQLLTEAEGLGDQLDALNRKVQEIDKELSSLGADD